MNQSQTVVLFLCLEILLFEFVPLLGCQSTPRDAGTNIPVNIRNRDVAFGQGKKSKLKIQSLSESKFHFAMFACFPPVTKMTECCRQE